MSFSSKLVLLKYQQLDDRENKEKRPKVYKRQQIYGSEDEKWRLKVYKRQQIDGNEDEERQDPTNYDHDGYISLTSPLEVSNCPSNLGKERRNLTHLISI